MVSFLHHCYKRLGNNREIKCYILVKGRIWFNYSTYIQTVTVPRSASDYLKNEY